MSTTLGVDTSRVYSSAEFSLGTVVRGPSDPAQTFRFVQYDPAAGADLGIGVASGRTDAAVESVNFNATASDYVVDAVGGHIVGFPANAEAVPPGSYFWVQIGGPFVAGIEWGVVVASDEIDRTSSAGGVLAALTTHPVGRVLANGVTVHVDA